MRRFVRRGLVTGVVVVAAVAGVAEVAFGNAGRTDGGSIDHVSVLTSDATGTHVNPGYNFVDLLNMQTSVRTTGPSTLLDLRYSSEAACYTTGTPEVLPGLEDWCSIQILVDGVPAGPTDGAPSQFAYDTVDTAHPSYISYKSLAMERFAVVGYGTHTITVQAATTDAAANTALWQGEASLVIEQSRYAGGVKPG